MEVQLSRKVETEVRFLEEAPVYGAFRFVGTHGVPLPVVLTWYKDRGRVITWDDYILAAAKDGAKLSTVKAQILEAIGEVYGPKYRKEFETRLDALTGS